MNGLPAREEAADPLVVVKKNGHAATRGPAATTNGTAHANGVNGVTNGVNGHA